MTLAPVVAWPLLDHLQALTHGRGVFEHALLAVPRREHGFCVDDVARALVVVCRERHPSSSVRVLARRYLAFTLDAVQADGSCHNRMSVDGTWTDEPGLDDCWGRAVWGLGVAAVHAPSPAMRMEALLGFHRAAAARSPHQRALVFAALGAGEVLLDDPSDAPARALLVDAVAGIGAPAADPLWPWPEARLRYANGSVVEALLLAGAALPDADAARDGLLLLDFLLGVETRDRHLSVTPVAGRGPLDTAVAYDQQPIEVAAVADACARAFDVTADPRWLAGVRMAWGWFLGDNDTGVEMYDPRTGAGYDGLERDGRNLNQGAESTLAVLSTAQHAQRLAAHG